jgi:hypothetical protein
MRRRISGSLVLILVALGIGAALRTTFAKASQGPKGKSSPSVEFKLYPGAKTEAWTQKVVEQARKAGSDTDVYLTADSYEKVYAFYKAIAPEYDFLSALLPGAGTPQPTPAEPGDIKSAIFILDGAKGIESSKHWMKIQRPTIGDLGSAPLDVTSIQVVRSK